MTLGTILKYILCRIDNLGIEQHIPVCSVSNSLLIALGYRSIKGTVAKIRLRLGMSKIRRSHVIGLPNKC